MNVDYSKIKTAADLEQINKMLRREEIKKLKEEAYKTEADPLFFKFQRGEATKEDWLFKIQEIRNRFND